MNLMLIIILSIIFKTETCPPKPLNSDDLSTTQQPNYQMRSILYGCDQLIESRINSYQHVIHIYKCIFYGLQDVTSQEGGGAIYIYTTSKGPNEMNSIIDYCSFENCKSTNGGALSIVTGQRFRYFNITNSKFENNEAIDKGGAIYFNAIYSTVDACAFINNRAFNGSEIFYNCQQRYVSNENPFLIQNNIFESNISSTTCMIFLQWDKSSNFIFQNNEARISSTKGVYLFESTGDLQGNMSINSNCILPSKSFLCDSTNAVLFDKLSSGFPSICEHTNCPAKPSGLVDDLSETAEFHTNSIIYGCNLDIERRVNSDRHIVHVYYCTFNKLQDTSEIGGGAIYIYTTSKTASKDMFNIIYNCTFIECHSTQGGALKIQTLQFSRFFNISYCKFIKNEATNEGGAIYFYAIYSIIDSCEFIDNKAINQSGIIYFRSNMQSSYTTNPFIIKNSKFNENIERRIDMFTIYCQYRYSYIFENNEIRTLSTNTNFVFTSDGDLNDGVLNFSSNCISPSKEYLCDHGNPILYTKLDEGFPNLCDCNSCSTLTQSQLPLQTPNFVQSFETSETFEEGSLQSESFQAESSSVKEIGTSESYEFVATQSSEMTITETLEIKLTQTSEIAISETFETELTQTSEMITSEIFDTQLTESSEIETFETESTQTSETFDTQLAGSSEIETLEAESAQSSEIETLETSETESSRSLEAEIFESDESELTQSSESFKAESYNTDSTQSFEIESFNNLTYIFQSHLKQRLYIHLNQNIHIHTKQKAKLFLLQFH